MCVDALHSAFTKRSFACLFATPYESQARMIHNRLCELIRESPFIAKEVIANTKTPFEIKFSNGSSILLKTTGASSGGGAASLRGLRAD